MTTEGAAAPVQWTVTAEGGREWPLAVPRELFTVYQPVVGGPAVLAWLNLYELASRPGFRGDAVAETARRLGVDAAGLEHILDDLERAGLLVRRGQAVALCMPPPDATPPAGAEAPAEAALTAAAQTAAAAEATVSEETAEAGGAAPPVAGGAADGGTARPAPDSGLEAVVAFYHQRIGLLGPSQFEKLRFWLEEMGMSPDVIALAIEETVQNAKTPRMNYLEAVLRNWYNDGVRTVADLQRSRQSRASALPQRSEGAPNAAAYDSVDPDAVRRWKEMYADEYDG